MKKQSLVLGWVFGCMLSGCGLQKTSDDTLQAVQNSNALQQELYAEEQLLLAAEQQIVKLNQELEGTLAGGMHAQTLAIALTGLLNPNNTQQLSPPTLMVPYAQSFAQEATEDELISICDLFRQDAESGGGLSTIHSRTVDLTAIGLLAGLAQEAKAEDILNAQILDHGQYEETAYMFGEGRYMFLRDGMFTPLYQSAQVFNIGTLAAASQVYVKMKTLKNLSYSNLFHIQVSGLPVNYQFDPNEVVTLGQDAKQTFTQKLDPTVLQTSQAQTLLATFDQ